MRCDHRIRVGVFRASLVATLETESFRGAAKRRAAMLFRRAYTALLMVLVPTVATAQEAPVERIRAALRDEVAAQVIEVVEEARARSLPDQAVANLVLEGVAKGRSGEEVLGAAQSLVGDLTRAQDAIRSGGRAPRAGEVEAAAAAMRMGADGASISELARSQPPGRSLAVPILAIGGLTERGLPSDEALARVAARLQAQADDAAMMSDMPGMGAGMAQGGRPPHAGPGLAPGLTGFQVPVAGMDVPIGPPSDLGRGRPGNLPGRGNEPGPPGPPGPPGGA